MVVMRGELDIVNWLICSSMCCFNLKELCATAWILCQLLLHIPYTEGTLRCTDQQSISLLVPIQAERLVGESG